MVFSQGPDAEGNVYLMDQQLNNVTVVSPRGEVLRRLFREGDGPGEIRTPQGIAVLAANQGFSMLAGCTARSSVLLVAGMYQVPSDDKQTRTSYVAKINPEDGSEFLRYRVHDTVLDFGKAELIEREMVAPCYTYALGPDQRVYFARDWRQYAIEVLPPDWTLERVITREFEPLQRTGRERDRINELFEVQAACEGNPAWGILAQIDSKY